MGGVLVNPQRSRPGALEYRDQRLSGDERRELAHHAAAGGRTSGVHYPPDRMTALQTKCEASGAVAVEADAQRLQVLYARWRLAHEDLGRGASDERASGALGVGQVQLEAVVGGERRGEAALCPVGGRLGQRRGRDEHDRGAIARRAESGVKPCRACSRHHDVGLEHWTGLSRAHFFGGGAKRGLEVGGAVLVEV